MSGSPAPSNGRTLLLAVVGLVALLIVGGCAVAPLRPNGSNVSKKQQREAAAAPEKDEYVAPGLEAAAREWSSDIPEGVYILVPGYLPFNVEGYQNYLDSGSLTYNMYNSLSSDGHVYEGLQVQLKDPSNYAALELGGEVDGPIRIDGRSYYYSEMSLDACQLDLWEASGGPVGFHLYFPEQDYASCMPTEDLQKVLESMVRIEGTAPNAQQPTPQEPTSSASPTATVSASPSPSSSEEALLEQFAREYDEATRQGDWEATYSMLDESSQQKITEGEWTDRQQALRDENGAPAPLESVTVEQNERVSDSPATVTLNYEDGTKETMKAMIPMVVEDPTDAGVPKRYLTDEEVSNLKQASSATQESTASPESTTGSYGQSTEEMEADAEAAAGEYYRAAGVGDWGYTYEHLDSTTRPRFTRDEWFQKNEFLAGDGSAVYYIDSVNGVGDSGEPTVEVTVRLTFGDGSTSTRNTFFVYEDGSWKHRLSQEEYDLLMPDHSYEEFVQAQQ